MRYMIVTQQDGEQQIMPFGSATDSEALHSFLCFVDPGEEYTVQFTNVKPE